MGPGLAASPSSGDGWNEFFTRTTLPESRRVEKRKSQSACKPGSVPRCRGDDHSSGPAIAGRFSRPTRTRFADEPGAETPRVPIRSCSRRGLPCPLPYGRGGGLLPHRFTLTFEPRPSGGLFSVALSLRLLSAGVTRRRIRVEPGLSSDAEAPAAVRPTGWHRHSPRRRDLPPQRLAERLDRAQAN